MNVGSSRRMLRALAMAALLALASGCDSSGPNPFAKDAGGGGGGAGAVACEPLAKQAAKSVAFGDILGVGRDGDGTLYVVDSVAGSADPRVFVGQAGTLARVRVAGSGDSSQGDVRFITLTLDEQPTLTLALEISGNGVRLATVDSAVKAPSFDALPNRHDLTTVDPSALSEKSALDLPAETVIEYVAKTETGALLLVIRPRDNFRYEDFRVFYGAAPKLSEQHVDSVVRLRDGGTTTIVFELMGEMATAFFPVTLSPDAGAVAGQATLELKGKTTNLERRDPDAASLDGAKLFCLQ